MNTFDADDALEKVGQFNEEYLSINAFGEKGITELPTVDQTTSIFQSALKIGFSELLIHDSYHTYEEPYAGTVATWVEGLGKIANDNLEKILILNSECYMDAGDITTIITRFKNLSELVVIGRFDLSHAGNPCLERLSLNCNYPSVNDAETIGSLDCPSLKYLAIKPIGPGDGPPEGFGLTLIDAMSKNKTTKVQDLIIQYSDQSADIIEALCKSGVIENLNLLQLNDNELSYDPEDSVELLLKYSKELSRLDTFRAPLNCLMDEEREKIKAEIPNIQDSLQVYPDPPSWHFPFHGDKYGIDRFTKTTRAMAQSAFVR